MIDTASALRALRARQALETNELRREFQERATLVLRSLEDAEGRIQVTRLSAFRRGMKPLYDEFYGRFYGDQEARFYQLTLKHARESYELAGQIQRSFVADLLGDRVRLPFDKRGRERANS